MPRKDAPEGQSDMNIILLSSTECSTATKWPLSRTFRGARWNRTTDLSIIRFVARRPLTWTYARKACSEPISP